MGAASLLLAACASPAPALPPESAAPAPEYSAKDSRASCEDIAREWRETADARTKAEANIAANRGHNQALGYFGGLFPPLLLATEQNEPDKIRLAELQQRRDLLVELARSKGCPPLR